MSPQIKHLFISAPSQSPTEITLKESKGCEPTRIRRKGEGMRAEERSRHSGNRGEGGQSLLTRQRGDSSTQGLAGTHIKEAES